MFLRCSTRKKDGKVHRYWSVVENRGLVQTPEDQPRQRFRRDLIAHRASV